MTSRSISLLPTERTLILLHSQTAFIPEGEKGVDSITAKDRIVVGGLQRVRPGLLVDPKPENAEGDLPPAAKSSK